MDESPQARIQVSALVLTFNEESNIAACLKSLSWAAEVFVVDSFSTDATVKIAESMGARIYQHAFENCAAQWNWALENLPFASEWVLVLDADERVPESLRKEIIRTLRSPSQEYSGFYLSFRNWFMGRWLKHGGLYPTWVMRLFKRNAGRFGRHGASEHMMLDGRADYLQNPFEHCDSKPLSVWIQKHNRYADLEAEEYLREKLTARQEGESISASATGSQAQRKHWVKVKVWNRLPLLIRPFLFFFRNYFIKGGFLDGREGFIYHVLWSFWVRFLVDVKILELRRRVGPGHSVPQERAKVEFGKTTEESR